MEQVGDRQRMPLPEANTARYVTMGPRQTMGEQGYPTGVAGVAEERGRCSAERSCCRPQARRCLSHFTVGHKRVMLQARWRLSPMWALGKDGDHGGRTGPGDRTQMGIGCMWRARRVEDGRTRRFPFCERVVAVCLVRSGGAWRCPDRLADGHL